MSAYPHTWTTANLFEICQPRQWKTISTKELSPTGYTVYGANGVIGFYSQYTHEAPTLMITCRGATCGNLHISRPFSYINGNAMALDNVNESICSMRYLHRFLQARGFVDVISGSAQPQITQEGLRKIDIPIAPQQEQKRIADKLDTVLTRVDAVNTRLARVAPLLKRFRQSVLAAATSGRLTEDWRQEQSSFNKGQEIEWSDTTLRTCISSMSGGASPSVDDYSAEGVLALNKGDIKIYGHLASKKNQNRVPEIYATQHNNKIVRTGELLVTLRDLSSKADFLGLIAQYINAEVALPTQGMYKLDVNPNTNRKYLMYFSNSPAYREIMKREKVGATQVHLRNDQFLDIPIALPPTEEQTEIVRRIETLFAFADRLEARLAQAQTAATRLTPALLAKAFRGELVPQDPNDEPAAELLRRLQTTISKEGPRRGRRASPSPA